MRGSSPIAARYFLPWLSQVGWLAVLVVLAVFVRIGRVFLTGWWPGQLTLTHCSLILRPQKPPGDGRVGRVREEPAKRWPAVAWIPSLLCWRLGRQVCCCRSKKCGANHLHNWDDKKTMQKMECDANNLQATCCLNPPIEAIDKV